MTTFRWRHYCSRLCQSLACKHSNYWCSCSIVGRACSSQRWDRKTQMAHTAHQCLIFRPRPNSILYRSDFAVSFLKLAYWSFSVHYLGWMDSSFLFLSSEAQYAPLPLPSSQAWTCAETQSLSQVGTRMTFSQQAAEYLKYWSLFRFQSAPCECLGNQGLTPNRICNYPLMDSNWSGLTRLCDSPGRPPV